MKMSIVEASNGLFFARGILETGSNVVQKVRNHFGLKNRRAFNRIEVDEVSGTAKIFDKHGNYSIFDKEDVEAVIRRRSWSRLPIGYFGSDYDLLHSFIMREELAKYEGFKEETGLNIVVHHKNGNGLDNRRCNLEVVTQSENKLFQEKGSYSSNKTGVSGVCFRVREQKYQALISGRFYGYYDTIEEAAEVAQKVRQDELNRLKQIRLDFLKKHGRL